MIVSHNSMAGVVGEKVNGTPLLWKTCGDRLWITSIISVDSWLTRVNEVGTYQRQVRSDVA